MHHSTPGAAGGPCWHCSNYGGMLYAGSAARCAIGGGHRVQAHPPGGCVFWMRAVGSDDEDGPPAALDARAVLKPAEAVAQVAWAP